MARNKYPEETERLILDVAENLFLTKGYEHTSIQDIIDGLGGLSKGAVYHHFRSKEDIFNAVGERVNQKTIQEFARIRDEVGPTGHEKLRSMFELALSSSERDVVCTICPNMVENPRLLSMQVKEIFSEVAPKYVQPIIEEGIRDGSIQTKQPKELAEVMILLSNLWMNPAVLPADVEQMKQRVFFFNTLMEGMGVHLLDEKMMKGFEHYCELFR